MVIITQFIGTVHVIERSMGQRVILSHHLIHRQFHCRFCTYIFTIEVYIFKWQLSIKYSNTIREKGWGEKEGVRGKREEGGEGGTRSYRGKRGGGDGAHCVSLQSGNCHERN